MAAKWQQRSWGDLATLEYGKALRGYEDQDGPVRVYGTNGPIGRHTEPLYDKPSVVVGRKGAYRGVHFAPDPFWVIDTAFYLKPKTEFDMRWAYYELLTHDINGLDSGSAIPSTSRESFYALPVCVPPLEEQRAIAHTLGCLDDTIQLNTRLSETLEAIAQGLFKSWFIDFEPVRAKQKGEKTDSISCRLGISPELLELFPDSFQDSNLGEIPVGWRVFTIEELSEKVGMGPFGSSIKVSTFVKDGIPVISGQHLNGTLLEDSTFNFVSEPHAVKLASANVWRGDVVLTHRGTIGQVSYIPDHSRYERYVVSQSQFFVRCNISRISPIFVTYFFRSPQGQHRLLANASQVGVPSIARPVSYLKTIPLITPPKPVSDAFDEIVRSFHHQILSARVESKLLGDLRDTLLPQLLSGELRVQLGERQ